MPKVRLTISLSDLSPADGRRLVYKELSFVCGLEEAGRVFNAACEAATKEKANGKDEKVGGTD